MVVWSHKSKGVVAHLPCATPLQLVVFRMENQVCAFCFFKHCKPQGERDAAVPTIFPQLVALI